MTKSDYLMTFWESTTKLPHETSLQDVREGIKVAPASKGRWIKAAL